MPGAPGAPGVCLEVLLLTVLMWVAIWGCIDVLVRRLQLTEDAELALYLLLGAAALGCVAAWDGVDACALL